MPTWESNPVRLPQKPRFQRPPVQTVHQWAINKLSKELSFTLFHKKLVLEVGLEPTRLSAQESESCMLCQFHHSSWQLAWDSNSWPSLCRREGLATSLTNMVHLVGLEPTRLSALAPQASACCQLRHRCNIIKPILKEQSNQHGMLYHNAYCLVTAFLFWSPRRDSNPYVRYWTADFKSAANLPVAPLGENYFHLLYAL